MDIVFKCDRVCCQVASHQLWLWRVHTQDWPPELVDLVVYYFQFGDTINYTRNQVKLRQCALKIAGLYRLSELYDDALALATRADEMRLTNVLMDTEGVRRERDRMGVQLENLKEQSLTLERQIGAEFLVTHRDQFQIGPIRLRQLTVLPDFALTCLYRLLEARLHLTCPCSVSDARPALMQRDRILDRLVVMFSGPADLVRIRRLPLISPLSDTQLFFTGADATWETFSEDGRLIVRCRVPRNDFALFTLECPDRGASVVFGMRSAATFHIAEDWLGKRGYLTQTLLPDIQSQ